MHLINPFPDLLTYALYAPTLLRVAAALVLLYVAYTQWRRRDELSQSPFLFGIKGAWVVWFSVAVNTAVAAGLLLGYATQWAALFGALLSLKGFVWGARFPRLFPLCRAEYALLAVICLSLLLTGAGKLAFDLRL